MCNESRPVGSGVYPVDSLLFFGAFLRGAAETIDCHSCHEKDYTPKVSGRSGIFMRRRGPSEKVFVTEGFLEKLPVTQSVSLDEID